MKFNIRLNSQPIAVRMLGLALATLLAVVAIGGIRAIARGDATDRDQSTPLEVQPPMPMNEWDETLSPVSPSVAPPVTPESPASATPPPAQPATSSSLSPVPTTTVPVPTAMPAYTPPQETAAADPTNYGDRYATDIFGNPVSNDWLIVLHETVGTADSAIQTFQTPHPNEADQVSYHTVIRRNGGVVYIVPPEKRAYGAGNSVFNSSSGPEAVRTDPKFPPSVNNFAYHISLETPPDGHNDAQSHSGYTREQYQSLAWLIARTSVPEHRITTHQAIDQSGSRIDPRSFNAQQFLTYLHAYPNRHPATANQAQ
ncbi:N-acetylmuramoyl-L-alanine amidase [Thermocoleostomius sinensis]|uniref:N-acetylmuramoyl-L-alanine amidase n=1 Tax=Thermocoleostomius sinensis A174 TaxID=2016057 RepID=A0A9E8ZFC9_9CYAN|nr:N-acetylmuramoyl-L-alanine amidase [Thermocoleostomius sinensis]WAL62349.1 N-acetylmuramoyl-L-alanine amidase [Thermocoleostomius sinensis A174]